MISMECLSFWRHLDRIESAGVGDHCSADSKTALLLDDQRARLVVYVSVAHDNAIMLTAISKSPLNNFLIESSPHKEIPSLSIQLDTSESAELAPVPWIAIPSNTIALGHALAISFSLWPIPLPSWVQNGTIVFPEKS